MQSRNVFEMAARLQTDGEPYAFVTVLRAVAPTSARAGDKAVVTADGRIFGWIGGGCAQPVVIRTVREALSDGRPRQVRITPERDGERDLGDMLEFGMACHSGGLIELFVDPVLARPALVVFGDSPVATALARLAPHVGFEVTAVAQGASAQLFPQVRLVDTDAVDAVRAAVPAGAFVVVATQGRRDLPALRAALAIDACHVSFVASRTKAAVLCESLKAGGASPAAVDAIVAPAGQAISARTPEEIALSVLAALVAERRAANRAINPAADEAAEAAVSEAASGVANEAASGVANEAASGVANEAGASARGEAREEARSVAGAVRPGEVVVASGNAEPAPSTAKRSCCGG